MFKLKVPKQDRQRLKETLNIVDSQEYEYVITTDETRVEKDKINIVFSEDKSEKVNKILDAIAKGEDVFITGENEHGIKHLESRKIHYFMVVNDEVRAFLSDVSFIVKHKLYELEELLKNKHFIRVSKYALVNINKIDYIKPAFNSKLLLLMRNKEEVEVNRRYYKGFKKTLNL
jgi:DNA-binding LytR/AlgR family response regulator